MSKVAVLIVLACLALSYSAPINKAKLRFKVSGRSLPDKDTGLGKVTSNQPEDRHVIYFPIILQEQATHTLNSLLALTMDVQRPN